jgi:aspartyl/asparaginyl beta-hydroxylase (cupin superfamily)
VLKQIPDVLQAFFSIMSPGKHVPAHRGVSLGFLRYHMAFVVPERNPPTMRVGDRFITWRERECFVFDDTLEHEIVNTSDGVRVVLIIDVMRPLPWHLALMNRLVDRLDQFAMGAGDWQAVYDRVDVRAP